MAALGALAALGPPLADGTAAAGLFVAGAVLLAAWAAVAVGAWRRAVRRRALFGLPASGGGLVLLWLAPLTIAASSAFWSAGASGSSPGAALAAYVDAWRAGRASDAAALLAGPVGRGTLERAWDRQEAALRDGLVRLEAARLAGPGTDPASPLASVRFETLETGSDRATVAIVVARREAVRELLFGFLPSTSQRLRPSARLGTVDLGLVTDIEGTVGWEAVRGTSWRVVSVEIDGEVLATGG